MIFNYRIYESHPAAADVPDPAVIEQLIQQASQLPPRVVIRPKQSAVKRTISLLCMLVLFVAVSAVVAFQMELSVLCAVFMISGAILLYLILFLRPLVLTAILLYQKYAPERMRASCLFEPCCSEYMRRSILKHGAFKGIARGFRRISRCRYPNGGTDEP